MTTNASAPTASNEATLQRDVEASRVIVPEAEAAPVIVSGAEAPLTIVPEAEASPVIVPDIEPAPSQSDAETPPSRAETATRPISRQFRALYLAMGVTDVLCTTAAVLLADWIRFRFGIAHPPFLKSLLVTPIVVGSVFHAFGLYRVHQLAPAEEFRRVVMGVTVTIGALVLAAFWYQAQLSRSWIGLSWALALIAVLSARQGWRKYLGRARRGGRFCFRTLIVGDDEQAEHISRLLGGGAYGFRPLGLVSTSSDPPAASSVLGHVRDLRDLVRKHQADSVFVSSSSTSPKDMQFVSKIARVEGLELRVAANLPEVLTSRLAVQPVGGLPTLSLKPVELSGAQAAAKRMFDIVGAAGLLALGIPLWLLITAAVKLSSRGPVLFRQQRVGRRGAPFTLLKFRTMVPDAEAMLAILRDRNEGSGPLFKLRDDPRVTRVGKWLRRWSLDETPQLINVLRGDMSLVGPRPPLPEEVAAYELWQADRLEVRPGITGLWQVSGRSQLSFDDYVRLDLFYIENWSLTYDIFICAKTLPILLSGRGAY